MASFVDFLQQLLKKGRVVFPERPVASAAQKESAIAFLRDNYGFSRLNVSGPLIDFNPEIALQAAEFVRQSCWFLVQHDEPDEEVRRRLAMPLPRTPADHLSADLLFRYLPGVYRRAKVIDPADLLSTRLSELLRQWPLSGVLADVQEAPLTSLDFNDHPGLQLLYAERLARNPKVEWQPEGRAREFAELAAYELANNPQATASPAAGATSSER
jgi:hypothetical protein